MYDNYSKKKKKIVNKVKRYMNMLYIYIVAYCIFTIILVFNLKYVLTFI